MRVVVLYRPKSEHEGKVLDYARDFKRFKGRELERRHVDKIVIMEFPSAAAHGRCFTSREYLELVPLRDAGAEVRAFLLEGYVPDKRSEVPGKAE